MRGYCPKCKEYRSDDGSDAWGFTWKNGVPICNRCHHLVDLLNKYNDSKSKLINLKGLLRYLPRNSLRRIPYALRKSSKKCWRCGASVLVEDKICPFCGAKLNKKRSLKVTFIEFIRKLAGKEKKENRTRGREKEKQNNSLIAFSHSKRG